MSRAVSILASVDVRALELGHNERVEPGFADHREQALAGFTVDIANTARAAGSARRETHQFSLEWCPGAAGEAVELPRLRQSRKEAQGMSQPPRLSVWFGASGAR
jgi:hypothetical protein